MKLKLFLRPLLFLIAVAAILLLSDLDNRESQKEGQMKNTGLPFSVLTRTRF